MSRTRYSLLAVLVLCLAVPVSAASAAKAKITMSGSTSIYPLAVQLATGYNRAFSDAASFTILQGGSDIGIADVARGRVSLGNASRDPQDSDPGGLVFNKIARDGVCIITNPANPVPMTRGLVQDIFSGRIRNWSQVPGAKVNGAIQLIGRTAASGTQDAFKNIFLGPNLNVSSSAQTRASNGLVQQSVRSSDTAIGYVSFDFTQGTYAAPYQGVPCNLRTAKSGQYDGVRNFWMVTRGKATGPVARFLNWVQDSKAAAKITGTNWVPLS